MSCVAGVDPKKPKSGRRDVMVGVSLVWRNFLSFAETMAASTSSLVVLRWVIPLIVSWTCEIDKSFSVSLIVHLMARKACRCFSFYRCFLSSIAMEVWLAAAFASARVSNHSSLKSSPCAGFWGFYRRYRHLTVDFECLVRSKIRCWILQPFFPIELNNWD